MPRMRRFNVPGSGFKDPDQAYQLSRARLDGSGQATRVRRCRLAGRAKVSTAPKILKMLVKGIRHLRGKARDPLQLVRRTLEEGASCGPEESSSRTNAGRGATRNARSVNRTSTWPRASFIVCLAA